MNKQLILIVGGILLAVMLLVGMLWGWVTVFAYLVGILLVTLIVWARYALLKFYLKTYSLRTILYTNPFSAMLYSIVDPHRSTQSSDLDNLFPSPKHKNRQSRKNYHHSVFQKRQKKSKKLYE